MRETRDYSGIAAAAIFVVLFGALLWFFISNAAPRPQGSSLSNALSPTPVEVSVEQCGAVIATCALRREFEASECNEAKLKAEARRLLKAPLEEAECHQVQQQLRNQCPEGCALAAGDLLSIPGAVRLEFSDAEQAAGSCSAVAFREVTIHGDCVSRR